MSPLSQSDYTVNSTKYFIEQIKYDKIPEGYQVMSFDVKSLFTYIPLNKTNEITLERIYDQKEINRYSKNYYEGNAIIVYQGCTFFI